MPLCMTVTSIKRWTFNLAMVRLVLLALLAQARFLSPRQSLSMLCRQRQTHHQAPLTLPLLLLEFLCLRFACCPSRVYSRFSKDLARIREIILFSMSAWTRLSRLFESCRDVTSGTFDCALYQILKRIIGFPSCRD